MRFTTDKACDEACRAPSGSFNFATLISATPFIITFVIVSIVAIRKLFPILSGAPTKPEDEHYLPHNAPPALKEAEVLHRSWPLRRRITAVTFSTTIALATVLAELILCEIANILNPKARNAALHITVPTLLTLLIIWIPFLQLLSFIRSMGYDFLDSRTRRIKKTALGLQLAGFTFWLGAFWWLGNVAGTSRSNLAADAAKSFKDAALSRVGVVGISLMALLAGFASVSSPWHCFGRQPRLVTDTDIERKASGLASAEDMLAEKRQRLRAVERKMSEAGPSNTGFFTKVASSIRGDPDASEHAALQLEISGLETMATSLSTSLTLLRSRRTTQLRAKTPLGRCLIVPDYIFSLYCLYRILATLFTTLRRYTTPSSAFSTTDPINRVLGLVARHVDPSLDQAAWSRQISFLMSGIMLLLSFNSVLQTLHIFSRFTPGLIRQAQQNLPLVVAQISATYVISSALLLRSNLPKEVASGVGNALGAGVEARFVEVWFERWFLLGGLGTAIGIFLGRQMGASDGLEWDDADIELGTKRS